MKRFAVTVTLVALAVPTVAQEKPGTQAGTSGSDPMAGWVARKVTNEQASRKEIQSYFKAMDEASRKGDLDAAIALIDFPVLMVTDNAAGRVTADAWSQEQWQKMMAPMFEKPMPKEFQVTHKPTIHVLTDSLATVVDEWSMTMKGKKMTGRSAMHLVKVDGKWRAKSMVEGGWGDVAGAEGASAGTGTSGSSGTGSSGSGAPGSSGSDAPGSGASGTSGSAGTSGSSTSDSGTSGSGTSGSSGSTPEQGSTRTK